MSTHRPDGVLDAIIDCLVDGPRDHDQIARAVGADGSTVNGFLYRYEDRYFIPSCKPQEGKPVWRLVERVRESRMRKRAGA